MAPRYSGSRTAPARLVATIWMEEGKIGWRSNEQIPPSSRLISSPYDPHAHLSIKRETVWTGYKVHLTETCDASLPHLIVHVETTPATTQDVHLTPVIHHQLAHKQLLPSEHLMESGYVDGEPLLTSKQQYGIELLGPGAIPGNWQTKAAEGFDMSHVQIDWHNKAVRCPQGHLSRKWRERPEYRGFEMIDAQFDKHDCLACPVRSHCTRAVNNPRQLHFRAEAHYEALQAARQRSTTKEFKERYAKRSGIEGTISQGVQAFDLRRYRCLGMAKTHLQHLLTAVAMNVVRLFQWHMGEMLSQPYLSRFAALAA